MHTPPPVLARRKEQKRARPLLLAALFGVDHANDARHARFHGGHKQLCQVAGGRAWLSYLNDQRRPLPRGVPRGGCGRQPLQGEQRLTPLVHRQPQDGERRFGPEVHKAMGVGVARRGREVGGGRRG